jgi:hypothetical protein
MTTVSAVANPSSATRASVCQPAGIDLAALKTRQHAAWSSGDDSIVGTTLQIVGEELCEALDIRSGQRVLDAAEHWLEVCRTY